MFMQVQLYRVTYNTLAVNWIYVLCSPSILSILHLLLFVFHLLFYYSFVWKVPIATLVTLHQILELMYHIFTHETLLTLKHPLRLTRRSKDKTVLYTIKMCYYNFIGCWSMSLATTKTQQNISISQVVWVDCPSNPTLQIPDIRGLAELAHGKVCLCDAAITQNHLTMTH